MQDLRDEIKHNVPKRPHITRTIVDVQRLKVDKLMKDPGKQILLPDKPLERGPPSVPDFVRNVMGSSAGAGSGEFHVYRHLRRKEYARQHYMHKRAEWEKLEDEYHVKIEDNKRKADEETAKKRAKRLKKKQNLKKPRPQRSVSSGSESEEETDSSRKDADSSREKTDSFNVSSESTDILEKI